METEFEQLKNDLLMLPLESRASLAHALIKSLDDAVDEDAESVWFQEIRRRDDEIRNGTAKLKPANEALREARELLRCLK
ncbi:MAG TPA: addiction module protein [Pyrinomonadaceae bacterium]|nr:addiction module protein [Pyrinomonadaceae bacterium]